MLRTLSLSAALLFSACAHAQAFSAYATFSPAHVSGVINGGAAPNYSTTSFWAPGVGVGITAGLIPFGPVRLSLDLRGSTKPGTQGADMVLFGPKVAFKIPFVALKPYVQASGGYLGTRVRSVSGFNFGETETNRFAAYEVLAGVDHPLLPFVDLRLIEVGAGKGYAINAAGVSGSYTVTLFTIDTGVVVRF